LNKKKLRYTRKTAIGVMAIAAVCAVAVNAGMSRGSAPESTETTEPRSALVDSNQNSPAISSYDWENDSSLQEYISLPEEKVQEATVVSQASDPVQEVASAKADPENDSTQVSVSEDDKVTTADEELVLAWPLSGNTILPYSVDRTVYDPTLEQYRTNDNIWLSAAEGAEVMAAGDGTVDFVGSTAKSGLSVSISHRDGWRTTYAQLKDVTVSEGESVSQGEVIGSVAKTTKYGAATGDHLEFWVFLDDMSMDPDAVLN